MSRLQVLMGSVTNAQLAAWLGVVPSTIQSWKGEMPGFRTRKKVMKHLSIAEIPLSARVNGNTFVEFLKAQYVAAGCPFAHISGRDFTDPDRPFSHLFQGD